MSIKKSLPHAHTNDTKKHKPETTQKSFFLATHKKNHKSIKQISLFKNTNL